MASLARAAEVALEKTNTHDAPQRPYLCCCGDYHLTTQGLNGKPVTVDMVLELSAVFA
jgi:hypothetical protein